MSNNCVYDTKRETIVTFEISSSVSESAQNGAMMAWSNPEKPAMELLDRLSGVLYDFRLIPATRSAVPTMTPFSDI